MLRGNLACRIPERAQERHLACVVPDAGGDDSFWAGHAHHLLHACFGVSQEVDDQLGEGDIEGAICEWQIFGRRKYDLDARQARPARLDERLRWVSRAHTFHSESVRKRRSERPRPAANIESAHSRLDTGKANQRGGELRTVPTYEPVIGIRRRTEGLSA
jgi:hypothetical protein